jgi:hypothetical protein
MSLNTKTHLGGQDTLQEQGGNRKVEVTILSTYEGQI